jgi:hypothetical protein
MDRRLRETDLSDPEDILHLWNLLILGGSTLK